MYGFYTIICLLFFEILGICCCLCILCVQSHAAKAVYVTSRKIQFFAVSSILPGLSLKFGSLHCCGVCCYPMLLCVCDLLLLICFVLVNTQNTAKHTQHREEHSKTPRTQGNIQDTTRTELDMKEYSILVLASTYEPP